MKLNIKKLIGFYLTVMIILTLSLNSILIPIHSLQKGADSHYNALKIKTAQTWYLDPFTISQTGGGNGTWSWAVNQVWCDGSGTQNDPYVIENVVIDGEGVDPLFGTSGITIIDSNEYFIIQNTTITNTGPLSEDAAIKLLKTNNGVIKNNNLSYNLGNGIYFNNSDHNEILTNEIYNNDRNGIYFNDYNDYNLISENLLYSNGLAGGDHGIFLEDYSNYNVISKNKVIDTGAHGIRVRYNCGNTTIIENEVKNAESGIIVLEEDCIISQNIIANNSGFGLLLSSGAHNSLVTGNYFEHNAFSSDNALYAVGTDFLTITNNTFFDNRMSIELRACDNSIISNNRITKTSITAIRIEFTSVNNKVQNNYILDSSYGISFDDRCNNNEIMNNTIIKHSVRGISIEDDCDNNLISSNFLLKNVDGIFITWDSIDNVITNNTIQASYGYGLRISDADTSLNTLIYGNYFIYNEIQVYNLDSSTKWNHTNLGNYWSNYTGYDADDDGIGDIPHPIISTANGMDYYPIFKNIPSIFIDEHTDYNWEWAAQQFWVNGSGTEEDPYIIQNKIIDKQWRAACIEIRNSEKNFIISDCTLSTNDGIFPGIILYNVKNGEIKDNTITSSNTGIKVCGTSEVRIVKNQINSNAIGIELSQSDHIEVLENNVDQNNIGLYIFQSNNNIVHENSLLGCESCIIEYESENNDFENNICDPEPLKQLYITIADQIFTEEAFNITFFIFNATYNGIEGVSITAYWNGTDLSGNMTEVGNGYYKFTLTPILVAPGDPGILIEATISKAGFEDLSYSSEFSIDPDSLQKDETPSKPSGAIPWSTPFILVSTFIAIISLVIILKKKRIK